MKNTNSGPTQTWLRTGKEIIELGVKEVPMLLDPLFPKVGTVSLAGSSDMGKSYLLLQVADAIVNGQQEFLGFPLHTTHKAAIYLATEDDEYGLCPRLKNLSEGKPDLAVYDNLKLLFETKDLVKRLDELLATTPADLVIIDTFSDIYDGDMNQANKVRTFIQQFKEIALKHKTLIVFNHHCGKKNDYRAPHKDNLLGSQGFESSMRTVIELRKDFRDPNKRHLCIVKGNYIPETFKNSSYVLDFSFDKGFSNTGTRVSFENLVRSEEQHQMREDIKSKVLALRDKNLSYNQIAEELTKDGVEISKSTVGNICKDNRPSIQTPKDDVLDGQAA